MTPFLWALVAACIWGVAPLVEKAGLAGAPAGAGVVARSLGVMVGLGVLSCVWSPWTVLKQIPWTSAVLLALGGLLASIVGQLAFYQALKYGAVSQVTPVAATYPLVAAILGWVLLREPMTISRLLGAVCVVTGALLLRR